MRGVPIAILLAVQIGCVAPQRAGAERVTFVTLQSASGAFLGAIGGVITCHLAIFGLEHGRNATKKQDAIVNGCTIGGAVLAGGASLYGGLTTDREPERVNWIVVSLAPTIFIISGVIKLVNRLTKD